MSEELALLRGRIQELEAEVDRLNSLLQSGSMSNEELVCVQEIAKLKKLSDCGGLTREDAQMLDIYVKNLQIIRRNVVVDEKPKTKSNLKPAELFKIVKSME